MQLDVAEIKEKVAGQAALLDRVAAVADAHAKPLSARLFPAPGVKVGETVATGSPYLFDCPAMEIP